MNFATEPRPITDNPSLCAVQFADHQQQARRYLRRHGGRPKPRSLIIEIGGSVGKNIGAVFPASRYFNLDLDAGDGSIPTIQCDATKRIPIRSGTVDFVYSNNCFEHIDKPWLAASEIVRILKPGGRLFVSAPWAWRYHPVPIDYWRFSPQALASLFEGLETLESGFNSHFRRMDIRGHFRNRMDHVPVDELGGWRENWLSFVFMRKPLGAKTPLHDRLRDLVRPTHPT